MGPFEDHLSAPRGHGRLDAPSGTGAAGGAPCGDVVRIDVDVDGDRVARAGFEADGCGAALAAGSAAVALVSRHPFLDAARVGAREISAELGGLSPGKLHAATLAADALHRALGAASQVAVAAPRPDRTLVALSGGVDSAVAAWLAAERGDDVVAVTLELWADPAVDTARSCCSSEAVGTARALAHRMGMPHLTLDLRESFGERVVADFLDEHRAGRTPNPCVRCNGLLRFDAMLALADRLGAARLATGHYARVEDDGAGPVLALARDTAKDQTYMLSALRPERLDRIWFPLGELTKPEVRDLARAAGLPVAERPESQDLCFLAGAGGREAFLRRHASDLVEADRGGEIVDLEGRVLGHHAGQRHFTIGQRRGLGVAAAEPLYVVSKDAGSGRVRVGPRPALHTTRVTVRGAELRRPSAVVDRVKLRYRSAPLAGCVTEDVAPGRHPRLTLDLAEPADGVAPGQTACLMHGNRIVGWGVIAAGRAEHAA
ncbi:MAG TPA: tRNA 2-thiouridine(34) synthase MnmA [Thermoleophilaceae bacterium]|nr:tRNA 2-thiouridine(34) synthase MnmA [Thermoleophilaceae bacterium]